jgi:DNA (cytosine-5)-methyltransferase 1
MFLVCDRQGTTVSREDLHGLVSTQRKTACDIINWKADYPVAPLRKPGRAKATLERAERAIAELGMRLPFLIVYYGSDYAGGWQTLDAPLRTVTTVDRFGLVTWKGDTPYLRMLQPDELLLAMGGSTEHLLPHGSRRDKVKLCGNGVCSDVMTAIFQWISLNQAKQLHAA